MRKKSSNPISLFSFQDIITSLTGIMIVVVLVILLQLVEAASQAVAHIEKHPEFQVMRDKAKELRQRKAQLEKELAELARAKEKPSRFSQTSVAELNFMLKQEQAGHSRLRENLDAQSKVLSELLLQISQTEARIAVLKEQIAKEHEATDKLKELSMLVATLRKRRQEITEAVARKKKMLNFEFSGYQDKTPVLVEVNLWGFRAKVYPDGEVKSFGTPGKAYTPLRQLGALKEWLSSRPGRTYPVVLYRRETWRFDAELREALGKEIGRELLGTGEECF
jgi:hypothetical protein